MNAARIGTENLWYYPAYFLHVLPQSLPKELSPPHKIFTAVLLLNKQRIKRKFTLSHNIRISKRLIIINYIREQIWSNLVRKSTCLTRQSERFYIILKSRHLRFAEKLQSRVRIKIETFSNNTRELII